MSLGRIRNLDYAVLLCNKMEETRAFYRDIMKFPIETDLKHWISFRVGAAPLTLRPRGAWSVCDDGKSMPGSAAIQLAFRVCAASGRCLPCGIGRHGACRSSSSVIKKSLKTGGVNG